MGEREMLDLADYLNISINGSLSNKRTQLDNYFRAHQPNHARTDKGHLIFNCTFDPDQPRKITDLSMLELDAVINTFSLPKPSLLSRDKKSIIKHVQKHFLKKYPNIKMIDGNIVFGRGNEPKSKKP